MRCNVFAALDKNIYDVFMIDIHPTGWWYENEGGEEVAIDKSDFSIMYTCICSLVSFKHSVS